MKKVWFMLAMMVCILASCSGGGEEPITPTPKPEVVKSEITIDSGIISNGLSFSDAGGEQSISFTTNESWTLSVASTTSGAAWCTASATSGAKGSASVKFTVAENTSYDNRSVSVTIKSGTATKTFTISQKGVDALLVTTDKYEVAQEGGSISIEVKANIDYKMEISEEAKDWIKESSSRALTAYKHTLSISANEELEKREGEIHFKSGDKVETVKVYQAGGAILLLSQNEYNVSDKGDTISVDIKSNFEFIVQMPDVDWIVDEASSRGLSSHTLKYVIKANEGYDARSAEIVFFDKNSELKDTLKVVQAQKDAIILSQKEIVVDSEGEIIEVKLSSNVDFDIAMPDVDWIKKVDSRGLVEHCLYFKIDANENNIERNAEIVFNCSNNNLSDTLKIEQEKFVNALYLPSGETFNIILRDYYLEEDVSKTKLRFVANSNKISNKILLTDVNGSKAYLITNGEWVEIHTSADEFIAHNDCSNMFRYIVFTAIDFGDDFNTSNVEDMSCIFMDLQQLKKLDIDAFDTSNVKNMYGMFIRCHQLEELNVSHFDVSKVTNMRAMFQGCEKLKSLDVTNFDTRNVVDMSYVFSVCTNLEEIDLSKWDTSNVENMEGLFWECWALKTLDISSFNTENVTDMGSMFAGCTILSSLDVAHLDTSKVTDMQWMFARCNKLSSIDLSNFNTSSVTNMAGMFEEDENLIKLNLTNFDTSNVIDMNSMFNECKNLINLNISSFKTDKVTNFYGMFNNCQKIEELNLGKEYVIKTDERWMVKDFACNSTRCKIICIPEVRKKIEYDINIYSKAEITWVNALTNEIF